jgi:hypothetical protein
MFGIYENDHEVGFARVISDFATYAYIGDVFVLESPIGSLPPQVTKSSSLEPVDTGAPGRRLD